MPTREEILKIEALSQEEKDQIEKDGKFLSWDIKICFIGLFKAYKAASNSQDLAPHVKLMKIAEQMQVIAEGVPTGVEMNFFKIFDEKWKKLEPLLGDRRLELRPTTEVLEGWARATAYILLSEEPYLELSKAVRRMHKDRPKYHFDQIAKFCVKLSKTLRDIRLAIREQARILGDHDKPNGGEEVVAELDALTLIQKQILAKTPMNGSKTHQ